MLNANAVRRFWFIPFLTLPLGLGAYNRAEPGSSEDAADVRVTTTKSEWTVGGVVSGRTERSVTEPVGAAEPEPVRPRRPAQSGLLTAGDYDDILNPDLYAAYAQRFLQAQGRQLPFVDTRTRVAIKVVDQGGQPVPFAGVDVQRPGTPLHLIAAADGTASFYPRFDRIPQQTTVRVTSQVGSVTRQLDVSHGPHRLSIGLPGSAPAVSAMDLALVIDTTGSMGDEMAYLQAELDSIVARLKREAGNLDLRIGLIVYRDVGDDYVVQSTPLTEDIRSVRSTLASKEAAGGGDEPEAVDQAMAAAAAMQWRPGAAKAVLLVADAPPHEDGLESTLASTERLRSMGVQIVPVAASGVEDTAQYVMRTMAALTQGRYIFLTDDSGVGNPHAEPDVACYVVTRLDQLIARVLASIADGRRIEPGSPEIIRTVGHYDRGRCLGAGAEQGQS